MHRLTEAQVRALVIMVSQTSVLDVLLALADFCGYQETRAETNYRVKKSVAKRWGDLSTSLFAWSLKTGGL